MRTIVLPAFSCGGDFRTKTLQNNFCWGVDWWVSPSVVVSFHESWLDTVLQYICYCYLGKLNVCCKIQPVPEQLHPRDKVAESFAQWDCLVRPRIRSSHANWEASHWQDLVCILVVFRFTNWWLIRKATTCPDSSLRLSYWSLRQRAIEACAKGLVLRTKLQCTSGESRGLWQGPKVPLGRRFEKHITRRASSEDFYTSFRKSYVE